MLGPHGDSTVGPARLCRVRGCGPAPELRARRGGIASDRQRRQPSRAAAGNDAGRDAVSAACAGRSAHCAGAADATNIALADLDAVSGSLLGRDDEGARVRITTLHSLAYCWLIPRLPGFIAAHPDVHLDFETSIALARFDDAGPDLGIRHGPGPWPGLTAHFLMDDALFPVAAPMLPGVRQVTKAAHIPRLPLISDLGLQGWPDWFRAADVRSAALPAVHSFTDSTDALLAAVCGLGVALARRHIAAPYLERGELIQLPGPILKARFSYYVVHPAHRRPKPAAMVFIEWLRREAAKQEAAQVAGRGTSHSAAPRPRAPATAGDRSARKAGK